MEGAGLKGTTIRRGLFVAVSVSVAAVLAILFLTMDRDTWKAVADIKPVFLLVALVLLALRWVAHVARTVLLVRAAGERLGIGKTTKTILSGSFAGAVTPLRVAGIPVEIFFLHVYGLPTASATAVVTTGSAMSLLLYVVAMPVILTATAARVNMHVGFRTVLLLAGIIALLLLLVAVFAMRDPRRAASLVEERAPSFLKRRKSLEGAVEKFFSAIGEFSDSLHTILGYSIWVLLAAAGLTVVVWASAVFIPAMILWSLGYPELFWQSVLAQLVVAYLLPFMPVPGESGMAEATFAGVYALFVPASLIGVLTLAWRFINFYLALAVSGVGFVLASRDASRLGFSRLPGGGAEEGEQA